jgi:spore coat protein U-like protein
MMTGSAQYNLFTDAGLSQIWGNGTGTTSTFTGSTGFGTVNFPLNIHGSVPANLDLAPGVHTDTVTATLSYRFIWGGATTTLPGVAIPVTMNVQAECRADTFNLNFGNYNPFNATALAQSSTVNVYCTTGTTATLSLDNGANASGVQKRMRSGTNYLNYSAALTFANGTSTSSLVPLRNGITLNGSVPAGQDAAAGGYTDTLQVVVNY